jgi:hypothetical protein
VSEACDPRICYIRMTGQTSARAPDRPWYRSSVSSNHARMAVLGVLLPIVPQSARPALVRAVVLLRIEFSDPQKSSRYAFTVCVLNVDEVGETSPGFRQQLSPPL